MTSNSLILTGVLSGFPNGDKKPQKTRQRRGTYGTVTQFNVALVSPVGETFEILLEAGQATSGIDVLHASDVGTWLEVEGTLMTELITDRRFATSDEDEGRTYADLRVMVSEIRSAAERRSQAVVRLSGMVDAPINFLRHHRFADALFGRTQMRVTGANAHVSVSVPVMTGSEHPDAGMLYRIGNRVEITGTIMPMMIRQYGSPVEQAVQHLDSEWTERKVQIDEKEARRALRHYRGRRASLLESPRLFVIAETMTLMSGEPITAQQASQQRRAFQQMSRKDGRGRLQQRLRSGTLTIEQVVDKATDKGMDEPDTAPAPVALAQPRPRRRAASDHGPDMVMANTDHMAQPVGAAHASNGSHDG